jgi:hypothetical protein
LESREETQKKLNKALKRNLEALVTKIETTQKEIVETPK